MRNYLGRTEEARARQLANLKPGVKGVKPMSPNVGRKHNYKFHGTKILLVFCQEEMCKK